MNLLLCQYFSIHSLISHHLTTKTNLQSLQYNITRGLRKARQMTDCITSTRSPANHLVGWFYFSHTLLKYRRYYISAQLPYLKLLVDIYKAQTTRVLLQTEYNSFHSSCNTAEMHKHLCFCRSSLKFKQSKCLCSHC